jgi:hypothetical protein
MRDGKKFIHSCERTKEMLMLGDETRFLHILTRHPQVDFNGSWFLMANSEIAAALLIFGGNVNSLLHFMAAAAAAVAINERVFLLPRSFSQASLTISFEFRF